ncbi:MAG: glycosyltransferase family 2 protein [Oscillospiraceae bacterium]|nr:glycosyltransferase family 2 protein [Oscillospiraceae bacterium]
MKSKFFISQTLGIIWLIISIWFAFSWATYVSHFLPIVYVWWVIIGIALQPGFLMSVMFFSNLLNWKLEEYPDTREDTTIIMCAHNEEDVIAETISSICAQNYVGHIRLLVVDNGSTDATKDRIIESYADATTKCTVEYVYCGALGKGNALNCGLAMVHTEYFITVDADTFLEENAVQRIMNHIVFHESACVAGNLFVKNGKSSFAAGMQIYDYLLSIAAIKRFQGSYSATLVAQGAFSAYKTRDIRNVGGWENCLGEDIVLTYQLLQKNLVSAYEPAAVGYTVVPQTLGDLYNQRKRWATGMLDGFSYVTPWRQGNGYSRYFTFVNMSVINLDLAALFGFIPSVLFALRGYYLFVGLMTLFAMSVSAILYLSMYIYQKRLGIPFKNSFLGFVGFLFLFQPIQSTAALHGYMNKLTKRRMMWK